jgi:predicted RNA-binding protein with TRAM domain
MSIISFILFIHITEKIDVTLTMSYAGSGGYTRRRFGSSPKPVEMGKEYAVEISEISRRGDGIARVQGFVIFVADAKAGQKVKIRITSIGDRFAKGEII